MQINFLIICGYLVAFKVVFDLIQYVRHAIKARQFGCKPPITRTSWMFGIDHLMALNKADQEKVLPQHFMEIFDDLKAKHGHSVYTVRQPLMGETSIFTCDPKNIQAVLATQFHDFEFGPMRRSSMHPLQGNGIFAVDGASWQRSRSLVRPQFTRENISDFDMKERHLQNALSVMPVGSDGWTDAVDMRDIFQRLTLDISSEFLFGESMMTQLRADETSAASSSEEAAYHMKFGWHLENTQWWTITRIRLQRLYWLVDGPAFRRSIGIVHSYVDDFVKKALTKLDQKVDGTAAAAAGKPKHVFLESLSNVTRDPVDLRFQSLSVMLAGRDTTAALLSFLFRYLILDPAKFHKLREVVLENFGTYENPQDISFGSLKACKYLNFCMSETLRLNSVVPLNIRAAAKDTTLPHGGGKDGLDPIYVKKGQIIQFSTHVTQRSKEYWGEDADEFRPERWEGLRYGWEYLPFSGGPRICVGQQFALTEAGYIIVRLLQRFDSMEGVDIFNGERYLFGLTIGPGDPVTIKFHEAQSV